MLPSSNTEDKENEEEQNKETEEEKENGSQTPLSRKRQKSGVTSKGKEEVGGWCLAKRHKK